MSHRSGLCVCTYRGCGNYIDPRTGKRGRFLSAHALRTHESDESRHRRQLRTVSQIEQQARNAQEAALKSHEEAMVQALAGLSISPESPIIAKEAKYKVEHKRVLVHKLSDCQERLTFLLEEANAIRPPFDGCSDELISLSISQCNSIRQASADVTQLLHNARTGNLGKEACIRVLLDEAQAVLDNLKSRLDGVEMDWVARRDARKKEEEDSIKVGTAFDTRAHFTNYFTDAPALVQLASLMVVVCHVVLGLPRRGCHWLFSMCAYIVETTFHQSQVAGWVLSYFQKILRAFPRDVRAATANFDLDGKSTVYAVCPQCHECHKPTMNGNVPVYPQRCNSRRFGQRCGELLLRPKNSGHHQILIPIKPYVVFDFQDWLARLMSRQGFEESIDAAWSRMAPQANDGFIQDIFQGAVVRQFKGPDGVKHFSESGPDANTGRYLFAMGCDFFNPLRNLANGKKISIGVIAFVCLNLPMSHRYKPENIFLAAVIPGPKEPSLDAINPYLRPFVEMFLRLWTGVRFSQTSLFPDGRWILCALIAIICDLPAARKVAGLAACSHEYFCSVCWCNLTENGYNDFNYATWTRRSTESCRAWAELYRVASTKEAASSIFNQSGLRCSVLLSLPYFDPTQHLVVDPMHNLFLGLIKEHFQNILGFLPKNTKPKSRKSDENDQGIPLNISPTPQNPLPSEPNQRKSIRKLIRVLKAPLDLDPMDSDSEDYRGVLKRFKASIHLASMVYVARAINCVTDPISPDGSNPEKPSSRRLQKNDLARMLINWRLRQQETTGSPLKRKHGYVFKEEEIQELWKDIENMIKPSWSTSVPNNISSAGAKLKSDQWRSIGALYLPVTLIRLWSKNSIEVGQDDQEQQALLHLTMLLCSAVSILTSRVVSEKQGALYLDYMTQYRKELQRLYPNYSCHANHHMAMHLGEFLVLYGPVHGWWTFPFERMIGRLQRILTNYKLGEYEATIGRSWTRAANFRAVFLKENCPDAIKFCARMFEKLLRLENRNTLAEPHSVPGDDMDAYDNDEDNESSAPVSPLSTEIRNALRRAQPNRSIPYSAVTKARIIVDGISYTRKSVHEGNSGILLTGGNTPYSIVDVLHFPERVLSERCWLVVRAHQKANVNIDPYAQYPHVRAQLWSNALEDVIEVVPFSHVETHFAKCIITWEERELAVVVSLSKSYVVW